MKPPGAVKSVKPREPLLADLLRAQPTRARMSEGGVYPDSFLQNVNDTLAVAKKFVLDDAAAVWCARMLRTMPRIVADAMDFAIPAFESMWIELPFRPFFREMTGVDPDETADGRVGYLFQGPVVCVAAGRDPDATSFEAGKEDIAASWMPVRYIMNRPPNPKMEADILEAIGQSPASLDVLAWGESIFDLTQAVDRAGIEVLRESHTIEPVIGPWMAKTLGRQEQLNKWWQAMSTSNGDLRNIIGLCLFLNRTRDLQTIRDVPMGQRMIMRKPSTLARHSVVSFELNPLPALQNLCAGDGIWRRLHSVRGHFCHDQRARQAACQHPEWEEIAPMRWRCGACHGLRWWRKEHRRGHIEKGVVETSYAVGADLNATRNG